jgi:hypothetical protein
MVVNVVPDGEGLDMQNWCEPSSDCQSLRGIPVDDQVIDLTPGTSVKAMKKDSYYQSQDMLSFRASRYITCWCEFGSQLVVDIGSGNGKREFI